MKTVYFIFYYYYYNLRFFFIFFSFNVFLGTLKEQFINKDKNKINREYIYLYIMENCNNIQL